MIGASDGDVVHGWRRKRWVGLLLPARFVIGTAGGRSAARSAAGYYRWMGDVAGYGSTAIESVPRVSPWLAARVSLNQRTTAAGRSITSGGGLNLKGNRDG